MATLETNESGASGTPRRVKRRYNAYLLTDSPIHNIPKSSRKDIEHKLIEETSAQMHTNVTTFADGSTAESRPELPDQIVNEVQSINDLNEASSELKDRQWQDYLNERQEEYSQFEADEESDTEDSVSTESLTENIPTGEHYNQQIYSGSEMNVLAAMLLILTFAEKYKLTSQALVDLIKLVNILCPKDCCIPETLHKFESVFKELQHPLVFHKYCSRCKNLLGEGEYLVCPSCEERLDNSKSVVHYIEVPIKQQLISLFAQQGFYDSICHRFKRKKQNESAYEDIYDGDIYKKIDILNDPHNISFTWNTDGIPIFKSSCASLWPFYLMINELPYSQRRLRENMVLAGVWFGHDKPEFLSYLKPLYLSLLDIEKNGVIVQTNPSREEFLCRAVVICGTCDLPARASVCNMKYYSGSDSCIKCEEPGQNIPAGKGRVQSFVPDMNCSILGTPRSDDTVKKQSEQAVKLGKPVHGIKGPSYMSYLSVYNFVDGMGLDYMHGILYGVARKLADLWLSPESYHEVFGIHNKADILDKRLLSIAPPNNISRLPRSIKNNRNNWKATEWKNWLLYYSLPIIKDILHEEYFEHYKLLVDACFILLKESILPEHLEVSEMKIYKFVLMFADLYGERYVTLNVHQLLHLPACVRCLGPLWCYSCFPFEDANGKLLHLFHGTQHVDQQIANAISIGQKLPLMAEKVLQQKSAHQYYLHLKGTKTFQSMSSKHLEEGLYALGAVTRVNLSLREVVAVENYLGFKPIKFLKFARIRLRSEVITSKSYTRESLRNSYTIIFEGKSGIYQCGFVDFFLQIWLPCTNMCAGLSVCECPTVNLAMVSVFDHSNQNLHPAESSMVSVKETGNLQVVELKKIVGKGVFVKVEDIQQSSISFLPNTHEKE